MDNLQDSNNFNNISVKNKIIICKKRIKETKNIFEQIDLRRITEEDVDLHIEHLKNSYNIIKDLESEKDLDKYIYSSDALQQIISSIIAELQIIGHILNERYNLDITERVESMRQVNKSLYSCQMYLKEAIRIFTT